MKKIKLNKKNIIITILAVLIILLIWGVIGANQAAPIGKTCDFGMGKSLCWFWSTNSLGEIGNAVNNFFNN